MDTFRSGITTPQRPEGFRPQRTQTVWGVSALLTGRTTVLRPRLSFSRDFGLDWDFGLDTGRASGLGRGGFALRRRVRPPHRLALGPVNRAASGPIGPGGLRTNRSLQARQTAGKARVTARSGQVAGTQRRRMGLRSRPPVRSADLRVSSGRRYRLETVGAGHREGCRIKALWAGVRAASHRRQWSHGFPQGGGLGTRQGEGTTGRAGITPRASGRASSWLTPSATAAGRARPSGRCSTRSKDPREGGSFGRNSLGVSFCLRPPAAPPRAR